MKHRYDCIDALRAAGINYEDACALRRISMTLHRWHELECGDGNDYGSWAIVRGAKPKRDRMGARLDGGPNDETFLHDDDGAPFLEHHHYRHGDGKDTVSYTRLTDRERGALTRLKAIMARYPGFVPYVQTDPRGCALYILTPDRLPADWDTDLTRGDWLSCNYSRGIAVHK